ncbi:MAG: trigger factor [Gammaproteobacteria bacterium AqS3]|nr:trigger factor [Gammaproteobacteria bacterium AqS3]
MTATIKLSKSKKLQRQLEIVIPGEQVEAEISARLREMRGKVKLPGFRKGKVSPEIVRQRYGDQARYEAVESLIRQAVIDGLEQHDLNPVDTPKIDDLRQSEKEVRFHVNFEIFPESDFTAFHKLKVTRYEADVTDADIEAAIQRLREHNPDWSDSEAGGEDGDRLTCDFSGTCDGEPFAGSTAEDYSFILGRGEAIEGFEDNLKGLRTGEQNTFTCTIPEAHPSEDLRGKDVEFTASIKRVEKPTPVESDEELAKKITPEGEEEPYTVEVMHEKLRHHLGQTLRRMLHERGRRELLDALAAATSFPVAEAMIDSRMQRLGLDGAGADKGDGDGAGKDKGRKRSKREIAKDRERIAGELRSALVLSKLAEDEEIKPDAERIQAEIERRAADMGIDPEQLRMYYFADSEDSRGALDSLVSNLTEELTIERTYDLAEAEVKRVGFEEATAAEAS